MSSITSISVSLSPADGEKEKLQNYLNDIDEVCIGGSYTDEIGYFDNPLYSVDDIMFKIEIRGFVQFYDIKNDILAIFKDYKGDLKIKIFFDNLENLIYGEIDIHKDGKGVCKYLDEEEVSKILNDNDDDDDYEFLDNELKENGQIVII